MAPADWLALLPVLALTLPTLAATGCSGKAGATVRGDLMANTTVGQNRCTEVDPTDKPFVVEWDATDVATFEAVASRDIVVVRYRDCELEVLDACVDAGIPGHYGAYRAPTWTTGSLEGFDIKDEYELFAKLPLGAVNLAGKIAGGNTLSLQYFVSGTVTSTRAAVYTGTLADNPLCAGATHFVRAYNLGAFELFASKGNEQGLGVTVKDAGAGAGHTHEENRVRQGGDLAACTADSAKELSRCKLPIRVSLVELTTGDDPDPPAPSTGLPPTEPTPGGGDTAFEQAVKLHGSAAEKSRAGDGQGCLADLDRAAELDPKSASKLDGLRATCEMQAGRCDDGKKRHRKWLEASAKLTPEQLDILVDSQADQYCPK